MRKTRVNWHLVILLWAFGVKPGLIAQQARCTRQMVRRIWQQRGKVLDA